MPLLQLKGDVMVLDSRLIHSGGTAPVGSGYRYIAFFGGGSAAYDYNMTGPVAPPLWAAVGERHCVVCNKEATTSCFACNRSPLCSAHAMEECTACRGSRARFFLPRPLEQKRS